VLRRIRQKSIALASLPPAWSFPARNRSPTILDDIDFPQPAGNRVDGFAPSIQRPATCRRRSVVWRAIDASICRVKEGLGLQAGGGIANIRWYSRFGADMDAPWQRKRCWCVRCRLKLIVTPAGAGGSVGAIAGVERPLVVSTLDW